VGFGFDDALFGLSGVLLFGLGLFVAAVRPRRRS
jgi:hypothetical protein